MSERGVGVNGAISLSTLYEAAGHGCAKECEELLLSGEDINKADDLGWTPLMHAVRNGHGDLAEILLSYGADACLINHHGVTAFTMTVFSCDVEMLRTLYDYLTPKLRQSESNNALQVACASGLYTTVKWLLSNTSAQTNLISHMTGLTALELAVIGRHPSLVELLLHYGADPSALNTLGHDVVELVQVNGDRQIQHHDRFSSHPTNCYENIEPGTVNSFYTSNNLLLDLNGDIDFKNSPSRPVFKTKIENYAGLNTNAENNSLPSPSLKSVFLPSPEMCSTPMSRKYNCSCIISPKYLSKSLVFESPAKSPKRGKKRKVTSSIGCSSWIKRFTKGYESIL